MVNLTIDGRQISVEENTTIMEAARSVGIQIPSLCYLKGINEIGACRLQGMRGGNAGKNQTDHRLQ